MRVIDRTTAKAQSLRFYYTGQLCPRGHQSERFTANSVCVACSRERRARPPAYPHSMPGEDWRPVLGYENSYQVSNLGRVKSLGGVKQHRNGAITVQPRILKPAFSYYYSVLLSKNGKTRSFRVHTLVLTAFKGPASKGMVCRHLDSDPTNNHLSNLCWGTPAENMADEYKRGCSQIRNFKLTESDVRRIKRMKGKMRQCDLARNHNVSVATISGIHLGKTWRSIQ